MIDDLAVGLLVGFLAGYALKGYVSWHYTHRHLTEIIKGLDAALDMFKAQERRSIRARNQEWPSDAL